jgi:hypothetical protein
MFLTGSGRHIRYVRLTDWSDAASRFNDALAGKDMLQTHRATFRAVGSE